MPTPFTDEQIAVVEARIGQYVTRVFRIHYEWKGSVDESVGALELVFGDGAVLSFDSGSDGEQLRIRDFLWSDGFEGRLSVENLEYVDRCGKWTRFDVSGRPEVQNLVGRQLVSCLPILLDSGTLVGVVIECEGGGLVRVEVCGDELVVDMM